MGYAVLLGWAVLGTAPSAALHAYTCAGPAGRERRSLLFASAVVLTVVALLDRQRLRRGAPKGWWKAAEEASPYWLRWVSRAAILYIGAYFAYDTFGVLTSPLTPDAALRGTDRILAMLFMAFHGITYTLVYTLRIASRQARERAPSPGKPGKPGKEPAG